MKKLVIGTSLKEYGIDLTADPSQEPVYGREEEVKQLTWYLQDSSKNSAILVGAPGVGKTAIVEALAQQIASGEAPAHLRDCRIFSIATASFLSDTMYRGTLELRVRSLVDDLKKSQGRVILFVDEIHMLVGAGSVKNSNVDVVNILKPALGRGEFRCIGATTHEEYTQYVQQDMAFARRFHVLRVGEPDVNASIDILTRLAHRYEARFGVKIEKPSIDAAVHLSVRFLPTLCLPDKALDIIQLACNIAAGELKDPEVAKKKTRIRRFVGLVKKRMTGTKSGQTSGQTSGKTGGGAAIEEIADAIETPPVVTPPVVTVEFVKRAVTFKSGIPVYLSPQAREKLQTLEEKLNASVLGQEHVIKRIVNSILCAKTGLSDPKKPIGSFILMGEKNVGKTELAKSIAKEAFDDEAALVVINMTEYAENNSISKLLGAPGYDSFSCVYVSLAVCASHCLPLIPALSVMEARD